MSLLGELHDLLGRCRVREGKEGSLSATLYRSPPSDRLRTPRFNQARKCPGTVCRATATRLIDIIRMAPGSSGLNDHLVHLVLPGASERKCTYAGSDAVSVFASFALDALPSREVETCNLGRNSIGPNSMQKMRNARIHAPPLIARRGK